MAGSSACSRPIRVSIKFKRNLRLALEVPLEPQISKLELSEDEEPDSELALLQAGLMHSLACV